MTYGVLRWIANPARVAAMLLLVGASPGLCGVISLETYKARVDSARSIALQVERSLRDEDLSADSRRDLAAQIRRDFPMSERVEWQGGTVETGDEWLLDRVTALESESDGTGKKQLQIAIEIREHLSTISYKLAEIEQPNPNAERTKDQDKQKLAEILRREEYQKPQQNEESAFQRWLREFLEWLESLFPKPSGSAPSFSGAGLMMVLQILLFAALFGLLGFIVYKLAPLLFPTLRRKPKAKKEKQRTILGEQLADDATAVDLFEEAERLAREGNLRGAIRKGYIALLCDLSDRKVIGLARNKTNRDYLRDVRSRRELHPRMKTVTDMFERHWYGIQESRDQDWAEFRDEYREAIRNA